MYYKCSLKFTTAWSLKLTTQLQSSLHSYTLRIYSYAWSGIRLPCPMCVPGICLKPSIGHVDVRFALCGSYRNRTQKKLEAITANTRRKQRRGNQQWNTALRSLKLVHHCPPLPTALSTLSWTSWGHSPGPIAISSQSFAPAPDTRRRATCWPFFRIPYLCHCRNRETSFGTAWKCLEMLRVGLKPQLWILFKSSNVMMSL